MAISLNDVQRGYNRWAAKPHNAKWVGKIDGTPIPNDIVVNIFEALKDVKADDWFSQIVSFFVKHGMLDAREEYDIGDVMSALSDNYEPTVDHLRRAVEGIADDYMTSETHHPGWVLIPEAKFEKIRSALTLKGACEDRGGT